MTDTVTDHEPDTGADYHVMSVRLTEAPPARRDKVHGLYRLVTLIAAQNSELILPASPYRTCAYIQALDDDVVISHRESDAAAGAGTVIPKTNTAPYPVYDQGTVYVAALTLAGASSRVSVSAYYCVAD